MSFTDPSLPPRPPAAPADGLPVPRAGRGRMRLAWAGAAAGLVVASAWGLGGMEAWSRLRGPQQVAAGYWEPVQMQSAAPTVVTEGPLAPASAVNIAAPFEGRIVRRWVQPGDQVRAGAPLLELDAAELRAELSDAEVAQIRAQQALAEIQHWSTSAEAAGARRQLEAAHNQMETAQGRLAETRVLFDKGIVARTEQEAAQAELDNATQQWHGARESLAATLRKGDGDALRIARLDAQARETRAALLRQRLARATLVAPQAGVVLAPPAEASAMAAGASAKDFEPGTFVQARELLLTLGDASMFLVRAQVDEYDVARVAAGQAVEVTLGAGEPMVLRGELQRVSAQARRDAAAGGGPPMFDVQVLVREVAPVLRPRLRLGMTARLRMELQAQATAMTIPLQAVRVDAQGRALVRRRAAGEACAGDAAAQDCDERGAEVVIQTGATSGDRVAVRAGLGAADAVWVPAAPDPEAGSAQGGDAAPAARLRAWTGLP